jgi:hypothetical protein
VVAAAEIAEAAVVVEEIAVELRVLKLPVEPPKEVFSVGVRMER